MEAQKNLLTGLSDRWREIHKDEQEAAPPQGMNIFSVLGIQTREVLLCRVLGALLDPFGPHGMGLFPLDSFLSQVCGIECTEAQLQNSSLVLEELIDESRRVDMVIRAGELVVPVEVKIFAADQDAQLEDYYRFYFGNREDNTIFYLSPDGRTPSERSKGSLIPGKQIKCLSFREDIAGWLRTIRAVEKDAATELIIQQLVEVVAEMGHREKTVSDYIKLLGGDCPAEGFSPEAVFALNMLNNADAILRHFKTQYLLKIIKCNSYTLEPAEENDKTNIDNHVLLRIRKGSQVLAWISAHKNLYISAKQIKEAYQKEWSGKDGARWKYLHPDGNGRKLNMENPDWEKLSLRKIYIDTILDQIEQD